jgi:glycosyl hydrolase family 42 (putative beta-galactosidase)
MPANIRPTDFHILYWNTGIGGSWRQSLQRKALRTRCAADAYSNCGRGAGTARTAASAHLRVVPYTTAFHGLTLGDRLLSEEWLAATEKQARETVMAQKDHNPLGYTLGDENYVKAFVPEGRFADTPEAWEKFQAYLCEAYPDIAALNAQWGTTFPEWSAIHFIDEQAMLKSLDNPSAWTDYRMFISSQFAGGQQRMRRAIQELQPGAAVGWDGCEQFSSYDGYDWWQIILGMDITNVYHSYLLLGWLPKLFSGAAVDSFKQDESLSGAWLNHADLNYGGEYVTWYLCLKGWKSAWWWHATFLHPANGALTWDLQPTPVVADMAKAAEEIKQGPATLLAHAVKQGDAIAVHYSENNWHASTIESGIGNHSNNLGHEQMHWMADNLAGRLIGRDDEDMQALWGGVTPKGHYGAAAGNVHLLLRDLGFQARTIARQEIEADELAKSGIKVLILPFVVSLSDEEVMRIRDFVEDGGTLIADYRCGLRDLHCRVRDVPALDDVFGIKREDGDVVRGRASVVMDYKDVFGARFEKVFHENIVAEGATIKGCHDDGTPALFIQGFGEGRANYLNCDLYAYHDMRRRGTERDLRELFRGLLMKEADQFAPFMVQHRLGHAVGHTEVTRFRDGDTRYFGVLRDHVVDDKRPVVVALPFPQGLHVYDVRARRYLGAGGPVETILQPGGARLFAALPYAVSGVSVVCPSKVERGAAFEAKIQIKADTDRVGGARRGCAGDPARRRHTRISHPHPLLR